MEREMANGNSSVHAAIGRTASWPGRANESLAHNTTFSGK
jgi:hypothetical protein